MVLRISLSVLLLSFTVAQVSRSTSSSVADSTSTALRNTLLLPLKQIHDALEPLQQMREDLTSIASLVSPSTSQQAVIGCTTSGISLYKDCSELYNAGHKESGVYTVYIYSTGQHFPVSVFCDMETSGGGWLVMQRRLDGSVDFFRGWQTYVMGFGNITGEFWLGRLGDLQMSVTLQFCASHVMMFDASSIYLGNELIHQLTGRKRHELRVDLRDHEGHTRYAKYNQFYVGPQLSKFALNISGYTGNAGDSLSSHNGGLFSTKDHDNDASGGSCAEDYKGAWWYKACHSSNLNGLYEQTGNHNMTSYADHVTWSGWRGQRYSLKFTEMKIRPYDF